MLKQFKLVGIMNEWMNEPLKRVMADLRRAKTLRSLQNLRRFAEFSHCITFPVFLFQTWHPLFGNQVKLFSADEARSSNLSEKPPLNSRQYSHGYIRTECILGEVTTSRCVTLCAWRWKGVNLADVFDQHGSESQQFFERISGPNDPRSSSDSLCDKLEWMIWGWNHACGENNWFFSLNRRMQQKGAGVN